MSGTERTNTESPVPRHIPTAAEIRSSGVLLSHKDSSTKVVRLGSNVVVKYGTTVNPSEGETMKYVSQHCNIRIPKVLAIFSDYDIHLGKEVKEHFIVMELIPGQTLESAWTSLTLDERIEIGEQVRVALSNIRSLIPPDYLGGINESRFVDGIFWTKPLDPAICGPFKNEVALNEGMICRIGQLTDEPHTVLIRSMVCQILTDHCTVFTHGDIQPKNIMVERINKVDDGNARFKVALIDFELSGWYPEYWEYATAVFAARWQPQWHELMQKASILESYPLPYLLMSMIRNIIFV